MKRSVLRLIPIVGAFILLAPLHQTAADDSTFTIGLSVCLTSECASDGKDAIQTAQLAADEINAAGGVLGRKIVLVSQDTAEAISGARAVSAYRQLRLDRSIRYFIGPSWTPGALSLAPIVSKEKDVIMTTPSVGVAEFHSAGANLFNARGIDEVATRKTAAKVFNAGVLRVAIFSSQQPWESMQGKFFAEEFKKLGGTIVAHVEPLPNATSISAEAFKIMTSRPQAVFFSNYVQMAGSAKELRKLGWNGPKYAVVIDELRRAEAEGALEGAEFYTFQVITDEFSKKFEDQFDRRPGISAGPTYDAVYAYAKAIRAAESFDPAIVGKEILKLKFHGASGEVQFDSGGCIIKPLKLWRVTPDGFERMEG